MCYVWDALSRGGMNVFTVTFRSIIQCFGDRVDRRADRYVCKVTQNPSTSGSIQSPVGTFRGFPGLSRREWRKLTSASPEQLQWGWRWLKGALIRCRACR
jgi:hypothetical protein